MKALEKKLTNIRSQVQSLTLRGKEVQKLIKLQKQKQRAALKTKKISKVKKVKQVA